MSFQYLTYCYEDKSFAVEQLEEDTNFAGPIHMSITSDQMVAKEVSSAEKQ